jgi:AcrR family transcriptional regulator
MLSAVPKLVDHGQRRAELLAAACRVVRLRGIEGTTTRAIADEAGCSLSVLAHFLGGKEDILVAAQQRVSDRLVERAVRTGGDRVGLDALGAVLHAVLPLDEERAADAHVSTAFAGAALSHPRLAEARRAAHRRIREHLEARLREARELGELRPGVSDEEAIDDFFVLVEGSTLLSLVEGRGERLSRLAATFLDQLRRPAPVG